jgi:hypothetical protein
MKHQMLKVLQPFPSFLHVFHKKRCHNMLAFILDPRFMSLQLVINYVGCEVAYALVVQNDEQLLLPLLIQCYKMLILFVCDEEVQV